MKERFSSCSFVLVLCLAMAFTLISSNFNLIIGKASSLGRPLIGVVNYDAWLGHLEGAADINSLTPEKWAYRLPYYAGVYDDSARISRNSNVPGSFVYHFTSQITGVKVYAAFDGYKGIDMANDIKIYYSPDNSTYTEYTPTKVNINAISTGWKKVTYYGYNSGTADRGTNIPSSTRYLKITINKTDDVATNPQIMRVEICYSTADSLFTLFTDDLNDFSKMDSHDSNLVITNTNPSNYRLVTGTSNTQQRVDEQIEYAKSAHIDYFAFVDVPHNNTLMGNRTIDLIRTSSYKNDIKYCLIVHYPSESVESWTNRIKRYVSYFGDSNYVTVCSGRPLVFIFDTDAWTSTQINQLRTASQSAGRGNPYIVGMRGSGTRTYCDAGSCYGGIKGVTTQYGGPKDNQTIPLVSFGFNDQPRADNPPPWGFYHWSSPEIDPSQMASSVNSGIQWCLHNSSEVEAWSMLIYSWNESAESASRVCPSRDVNGNPDTSRLDAIGNVIKSYDRAKQPTQPEQAASSGPLVQPQPKTQIKNIMFSIDSRKWTKGKQYGLLDAAPYLNGSNAMVRFRALAEALNATVRYDSKSKKITFVGSHQGVLKIGSHIILVDGKTLKMPVPVGLKKKRTFVPLRFVNQVLGYTVKYNPTTRIITVCD